MKQFSPVQAIWMSFYSAELYRDAARNWRGSGLLYLTIVLALCWLPTPVRWFVTLRGFAATEAPKIARQFPDINISNGVMQARPPGRHEIRFSDSQGAPYDPPLIIDDTIDQAPAEFEKPVVVLTRRELVVYRPDRNERRVLELTSRADMDVTRDEIERFLTSLPNWVPAAGYLLCLLASLVFRSVQACVYGALTQMFAQSRNVTLDFAGALRVSVVAVTPVIVIRTLLWIFFYTEPPWYLRWPAAVIITALYLRFAVNALGEEPSPAFPGASTPG